MKKYTLELIAFISGAVVMILELTGSRILAPHLGTSLFVWTSLIGIILGSLSLGYYLGGKIADRKASFEKLALILFISSILISLTGLTKDFILSFVENNISEIRIGAVIASIILFCPAGVFLGMVSPYCIKLKTHSLEKTGSTVGNLYAISTIGSIFGTFLAGFYLISHFGSTKLIFILAALMLLCSLIAFSKQFVKTKLAVLTMITLELVSLTMQENALAKDGYIETDTNYNHIRIYDTTYNRTGDQIRVLDIGKTFNSAMLLDENRSSELIFPYMKFYNVVKYFNPELKTALMIGGGTYSYPKSFLQDFPAATIDVVEIDPGLTALAKQYFALEENSHMQIYHEDGRTFLNTTENKYDVLFGDAFRSFYSIPQQLTTVESIKKMHEILNEKGVVLINVISAIEGDSGKFLRAEYATFKQVFPQVYVFPINHPRDGSIVQNIMLLALKSDEKISLESDDKVLNGYLNRLWKKEIENDIPILTDDFAPVDQYINAML